MSEEKQDTKITFRVDISESKNRKTIMNINKVKRWFFEKTNKIDYQE
jgi:hypothetical protein